LRHLADPQAKVRGRQLRCGVKEAPLALQAEIEEAQSMNWRVYSFEEANKSLNPIVVLL